MGGEVVRSERPG